MAQNGMFNDAELQDMLARYNAGLLSDAELQDRRTRINDSAWAGAFVPAMRTMGDRRAGTARQPTHAGQHQTPGQMQRPQSQPAQPTQLQVMAALMGGVQPGQMGDRARVMNYAGLDPAISAGPAQAQAAPYIQQLQSLMRGTVR